MLTTKLFSLTSNPLSTQNLSMMQDIDRNQKELHRKFASIHVAGTNGKGSVSYKIALALEKAGYRVGLYTSPHIASYRERIQVNRTAISEAFIDKTLPGLFDYFDSRQYRPSFFTILTALAFAYFAEEKVDYAVLEVGIGGEYDATNVVMPVLSVITSIAKDHADILGDSLFDIAKAKAGIIKPGVPVVIGPFANCPPIVEKAGKNAYFVGPTTGFFDSENSMIARKALEILHIPKECIDFGVSMRPPCRFEVVHPRPVILDVAHNPDGFLHLRQAVELFYPEKRFHVVLGMSKNRNPVECIQQLNHIPKRIDCVSGDHDRLASPERLAHLLLNAGYENVHATPFSEALQTSSPLLICGSFYIMEKARVLLDSVYPK